MMAMDELSKVILYAGLAGVAIPLGGIVAWGKPFPPGFLRDEFRHGMIAFGGGVLVAAVALVLVPHGMKGQSSWIVTISFLTGGLAFLALDRLIEAHGGSAAQMMAMVMDFIPEALALGAAFGSGAHTGPLLALLIGLQNLPEGFNSYLELKASSQSTIRSLIILCGLALLGPIAGITGFVLLAEQPQIISIIMLFASGGILYLTFQDIAPQSRLKHHWAPALGAVAGFLIGMLGQKLLGE